MSNLDNIFSTSRTGKYLIFAKFPGDSIPESTVVVICADDEFILGVLQSHIHLVFAMRTGGWLGVGNDLRYFHTKTFEPFPFPDPPDDLRAEIRDLAEELDATRKAVQAEHPDLTLTGLYNVVEKLRAGDALDDKDEDVKARGRVLILKELHARIDAAVARAYGWPVDLSDEDILARLVALNRERAAEERRGQVRWLRPEYQIPRFGTPRDRQEQIEAVLEAKAAKTGKPAFPAKEIEQTALVLHILREAPAPLSAAEIAAGFRRPRQVAPKAAEILAALARMGHLASSDGGHTFALRLTA